MLTFCLSLFLAFLSTALIAFGWHPCCCQGILTACCPDNRIPEVLTGTFSSPCACVNGVVITLTWNGVDRWESTTADPFGCGTANESFKFTLICAAGPTWTLTIQETHSGGASDTACSFGSGIYNEGASTCDPVNLVFEDQMINVPGFAACPCNGDAWTLTLTS